jgi:hypothetical protein
MIGGLQPRYLRSQFLICPQQVGDQEMQAPALFLKRRPLLLLLVRPRR